ncbi:MAG: hypothetical protein QOF36_2633 [Microbacteriaceae bacterium]|jgi:hypothetical protein|nr:hypothetical protein [Microbacteriaceae bacterium]
MSARPNYTDPWAAARVSDFIEDFEGTRWQAYHFDVDEAEVRARTLHAMLTERDPYRRESMIERLVPPGHYITLRRRATAQEVEDNDVKDWTPVMSDTPAEIEGHFHAIEHGTGRVLVHGLGLGCVVSALLAKPEVTHIDVVEFDPEIVTTIGPYYNDPRVAIRRGDALTYDWPSDERWDYVWHDIWSHISDRNLNPEEAEHGISYGMLFDRFATQARDQGAWAYEEALELRAVRLRKRQQEKAWEEEFFAADRDKKVDMVLEREIREKCITPTGDPALAPDRPIPGHIREFFEGQGLRAFLEEAIDRAIAAGKFERETYRRWLEEPEPIGNPNEGVIT